MTILLRYLLPIALVSVAAAGCATYSDKAPLTSVQQVLSAADDDPVLLRGQIVRQRSGDHYVLNDGTGEVLVEIKDRLPNSQRIVPGMRVEINGEVETRMFKEPKVEARNVTILAPSDAVPRQETPDFRWPEAQIR